MNDFMSVRYALLALLSEGPKSGPQLDEELEASTGEVRPLNAGQVYPTLQRLEHDGFVESAGAGADGLRTEFRITASGERELAGWLRTPPDLASPPHDELAAKLLVALRVPGADGHEIAQVHRRYLVELMQQRTRIKHDNAGRDLRLVLAVDAELFRLDSVIRWLDAADGHLERAADGHLERASAGPPPRAPLTLPRPRARAGVPPGSTSHQGTSRATDDRIRTSDADRERATIRLHDHYAEGRLAREELDERVTAALNARTFGDLRRLMADLPGPAPAPQEARQQARPLPPGAVPRLALGPRGPLVLPLVLLGMLLITGGEWPFPALFDVVLGSALIVCAAAIIAAARWCRIRRH
jgi:DNA-binding PadR family transcriptional regulator